MRILLVATYELGHQPLSVAGPAAVLSARGHDVRALDLAVQPWDGSLAEWADQIAVSVPMHTAARLGRAVATRVDRPVACYGLYAAMCDDVAVALAGRDPVADLVAWIEGAPSAGERPRRLVPARPARELLPSLDAYVRLAVGDERRLVGSVQASSGCAHRCRHCPVPVVYDGRIRVVDVESVVADAAQQVASGARHLTFTDPDFFNGIHHARRVVRAVHAAFPDVTFDCTVKVEHVLRHADVWNDMAVAGCLFVVSAFETLDDTILARLRKGHTAADASRAVGLLRSHGIEVRPSWLPFTPWSTVAGVADILDFVAAHDLVDNVDPVQYTIRLLLPRGSLLLGDVDVGPWDPERLAYPWSSPLDGLQAGVATLVETAAADAEPIGSVYQRVRAAVGLDPVELTDRESVPRLTEAWFCCAEPTAAQQVRIGS